MMKKKSTDNKKELSQAGMARINLTFYTLSTVKRLIVAINESIEDAAKVCDIVGQSLLYQIGLNDEDIVRYHKEHLVNIKKEMNKKDSILKEIGKEAFESLPFSYDEKTDELMLSKKLDGEIGKIKKKFIEGYI